MRELAIVTTGVLIALLLENAVQRGRDRALVAQYRETITREIADNRSEIGTVLDGIDARRRSLDLAMRSATDLLTTHRPSINEIQLGFSLADLSTASWETAASTGALSHMDYAEAQKYANVYTVQNLYASRQQGMMEHLAAATTMFADGRDPKTASVADLEQFRRNLLAMRADLLLEEQLAARLAEIYDTALGRRTEEKR